MRRHGWGGKLPVDDDDARSRILAEARALLAVRPDAVPSISEVADRLSVTRQTVYRYFPSVQALLVGAVTTDVDEFLGRLAVHVGDTTDASEAMARLSGFVYGELRRLPALSLLLATGGTSTRDFTSPDAVALGRAMLRRLNVDWAAYGFDDASLDELVELQLRLLASFVFSPGEPPRTADDVTRIVRTWFGPALARAAQ